MGLKDDLTKEVGRIFREKWTIRDGKVVPDETSVKLANDGIKIEVTVLYADLAESTGLVDKQTNTVAAEIYKSYLHCATKIIRSEGGEITAFDGDRVMAVFYEGAKNTSAAKAALKINYAVQEVINPGFRDVHKSSDYEVKQAVGIDTSTLLVAKTGIRNFNDLVWVGKAANYAAKLCSLRTEGYTSWITGSVYDAMLDEVKKHNGQNLWEERVWTPMNKLRIFRSNRSWKID